MWERSRRSPRGMRSAGMVLAAVLLMVMVTQTRGKSQLSIVEDIDKSLEHILRDLQSLQQLIAASTTPGETTYGGASTPGASTTPGETTSGGASTPGASTTPGETTSGGASTPGASTTPGGASSSSGEPDTTSIAIGSSSTYSDTTTDSGALTTDTTNPTSDTVPITDATTDSGALTTDTTNPTSDTVPITDSTTTMATTDDTTTATVTTDNTTTATATTDNTTTATATTDNTTTATTDNAATTTTDNTTTATATTDKPTTATATTDDTTTATTDNAATTTTDNTATTTATATDLATNMTTTHDNTPSTTTTNAATESTETVIVTTESTTTTPDPGGPVSNDRVKRRNLLSLAALDNTLSAWVEPRIAWLKETTSLETSDVTSDITSSEFTVPTSTAPTTPVSDRLRLEAALNETHQVVTQVAAGTITEDQVRQMQEAEAEVKDVTGSPDDALLEDLHNSPGLLDDAIEQIQQDQETLATTLDQLKQHRTGVIVGSVLGGLLLVVLVAVGAFFYVRHRNKKRTGGKATAKKRSQSASASVQQQMVELGSNLDDLTPHDEFPPHSLVPPNPLIPRANLDNFSQSSGQRNSAQHSNRSPGHDPSMQVGEMRTEPGVENPGYVEELPLRPVVPPKPRNRSTVLDKFGMAPSPMRTEQEPSGEHFAPSQQSHYIDELNYQMGPRERQVRPVAEIYHSPTRPSRRSSRDPSPRHRHHLPRDHRSRPRNDHHVRRTPSVPPPDYTIARDRHHSPKNFIAQKHHSQQQQPSKSPYEFAVPRRTSAPPKPEAYRPRTIRNRSDIRRPYGPEDLY